MKILLVRPKPHKESIGLQKFMVCEPLELEYLSSCVENSDHTVEIIDMIIEVKPLNYFINKYKPDVVGFTAYLPHVGIIRDYAKIIKEINPFIYTIVGGIHAEVVPEDFEDSNIDYIVKVNGLKTFRGIIENLSKQSKSYIKDLPGVWNGKDKSYEIETNFNYAYPDREKTKKYRDKYNYIYHERCATLKTSFGCTYNCEFCFCVQIAHNKYFERNIDNVIEEIKTIREQNIFIVDDNFLVNTDRIKRFCSLLEENNIKKNFILFGRADFIVNNEQIIKILKDHGALVKKTNCILLDLLIRFLHLCYLKIGKQKFALKL